MIKYMFKLVNFDSSFTLQMVWKHIAIFCLAETDKKRIKAQFCVLREL